MSRWSDEDIFEAAKKYDRPIEFNKSDSGKYTVAQVRGLLSSLIYKSGMNSAQLVELKKEQSKENTRARQLARNERLKAERAARGLKTRKPKQV